MNGPIVHIRKWVDAHRSIMYDVMNWVVLALALALVIYLSVNILSSVDFMHDATYMRFQLWVCVVFMAVFFIEWLMSERKWHYLLHRWLFFVLSVPYTYIIGALDIHLSDEALYFIHFVPLARGVLAGSMVVGYVSTNRITGIFFSYVVVMVSFAYFGSLIFWAREQGVNPGLPDYWAAVWWACSQATTVGCTIFPVTVAGQVVAAVLAVMGMIMFPLFTVYITNVVRGLVVSSGRGKSPSATVQGTETEGPDASSGSGP